MEKDFNIHEWQAKYLKEDFNFGGLNMAGDEPTPIKVDKTKQEISNIASTMEDAFQSFTKEVQQKHPGIFQDKELLDRINTMAEQIKRLKRL